MGHTGQDSGFLINRSVPIAHAPVEDVCVMPGTGQSVVTTTSLLAAGAEPGGVSRRS
jgi:hypothetical protein